MNSTVQHKAASGLNAEDPISPCGSATAGVDALGAAKLGDQDLRILIESIDPISVICTDAFSTQTISRAYDESCKVNTASLLNGRRFVSLGDFTRMLEDDDLKQKAWHLLKTLRVGR